MAATALLALVAAAPALGTVEGRCRPHETGPAIIVTAVGFKDATGTLRLEVYPPNRGDFLGDDTALVAAGKTFRRVVQPPPRDGAATLCIRVPAPGRYAMALIHSRSGRAKFDWTRDGSGFPNNPAIGLGPPSVGEVILDAGPGLTATRIVMNYRTGLLHFGPLKQPG